MYSKLNSSLIIPGEFKKFGIKNKPATTTRINKGVIPLTNFLKNNEIGIIINETTLRIKIHNINPLKYQDLQYYLLNSLNLINLLP